jgi:hypothetical protein
MNKTLQHAIATNLSWLNTMKQKKGYAGPVIHYWQDSINFIGPSMNWCYEGLIAAFLTLYKKTQQEKFLHLAIEAGNHLLKSQLASGIFLNSHFEANPSLGRGSTPHDTAATLSLIYLADVLKQERRDYLPYLHAAQKNIENYHLRFLFDADTLLFRQCLGEKTHLYVPNKLATIIELLLAVDEITSQNKYRKIIEANADCILQHQDKGLMAGGIYQTEQHTMIISLYTARCIPALLKMYKATGKKKYYQAAKAAGEFLKTMRNPEGGYHFGYIKTKGEWKMFKYPIFIAGSGDITRALLLLGEKNIAKEDVNWLLKHQMPTGAFMTSYGMNLKNREIEIKEISWRDVIPVVGWNDKTLRLLAEVLPPNTSIPSEESKFPYKRECSDACYKEDQEKIKIEGKKESHVFYKKRYFSSSDALFKMVMYCALPIVNVRSDRKIDIKIIDKLLKRGW